MFLFACATETQHFRYSVAKMSYVYNFAESYFPLTPSGQMLMKVRKKTQ